MPRLQDALTMTIAASALAALSLGYAHAAADTNAAGDASEGAKLVQSSGCEGCHGAGFAGGPCPKLIGIEKRLTADQIAEKIKSPKAPMPNFGFNAAQLANLVAYLSALDGGTGAPVVKVVPPRPTSEATVLVTFTGTPPTEAQVQADMQMGTSSHGTGWLPLQATADPHTLAAKVHFTMGGPWTVRVRYPGGKEIDIPLNVEG
jgi:mono/diheme cytochrome c family protein